MNELLSIYDLLLPPIYILLVIIYAHYVKIKNINQNPEYGYFVNGLIAHIVGAFALGLVYFFYYKGGDTLNYFQSAKAFGNLFFKNKDEFFEAMFSPNNGSFFSFDNDTGFPVYMPRDANAFFVVRLLIPLVFLGSGSYFATSIVVALVTYGGVWRLFQIFVKEFPHLKFQMAIACLFIPSCVFWGSGIMKDSFTLSAVGWFTFSFHVFFILKKRKIIYLLYLFIASFVIIAIKPYIFFALFPGSILWLSNNMIKGINNYIMQKLFGPIIIVIGSITAYFLLLNMGEYLNRYSVDKVFDQATVIQKDMKADYYGGNSFDIGDFDGSLQSVALKAPIAVFSGLFRPSIIDVKNIVMFFSSLENTYLLFLTVFLVIKLKFFGFFKLITKNPLVQFSMLFSLFFAFSVGLTVANFGSLVRLRIPELPFFVASIFILRDLYIKQSGRKMYI
ncbi:MAG: hypothetical protein JSU07_09910 [Bacteroidetes bacterium]|nr:hypothetical protein [Bacteroidota bacterium]